MSWVSKGLINKSSNAFISKTRKLLPRTNSTGDNDGKNTTSKD